MKRNFFLLCFLICYPFTLCFSVNKYISESTSFKVDFELVNNLIVIPVNVNGAILSFVLDTGITRPILFNSILTNNLVTLKSYEKVFLRGLGDSGKIEALKSSKNVFKIGDAVNVNQELYVINDPGANFAPRLGVPIHGVIGFDIFKDFVIEINYISKRLKFINYKDYKKKKCKSCEVLHFNFYNKKPYTSVVSKVNNKEIPVKLLIDTGSSDSLWLFKNDSLGITYSDNYFEDILGFGLSGNIYGNRSKIQELSLKSFVLKSPKVAFPDEETISMLKIVKDRNGSIGGELLKRFKVTFNYRDGEMILKKNRNFKNPFNYNRSGIVLEHDGIKLILDDNALTPVNNNAQMANNPIFVNSEDVYFSRKPMVIKPLIKVFSIRKNSPAAMAGLRPGDIVLSVNNKNAKYHSMQSMQNEFYQEEGDIVDMVIERYGVKLNFYFTLKSPFNKKSRSF